MKSSNKRTRNQINKCIKTVFGPDVSTYEKTAATANEKCINMGDVYPIVLRYFSKYFKL